MSRKPISEATRKKMSLATSGKNNPMYGSWKGKKHTPETLKKMSESAKKRTRRPFTRTAKKNIGDAVADGFVSGKHDHSTQPKHYKHGHFMGTKCGRVFFRSALELGFFEQLEASPIVTSFEVEPLWIPYMAADEKRHRYIPDLLVTFVGGMKKLVELKPQFQVSGRNNRRKFAAGRRYAENKDLTFDVWTERAL